MYIYTRRYARFPSLSRDRGALQRAKAREGINRFAGIGHSGLISPRNLNRGHCDFRLGYVGGGT